MPNETVASPGLFLYEYLPAERIIFLRGKHAKDEVLNALIDNILENSDIDERDDVAFGIFHQDAGLCTCIGKNIATPYCSVSTVDDSYVALAVVPDGIADMPAPDTQPVRLVFMIVAGKGSKTFQTKLISRISNLFFDGRLRAAFLAGGNPAQCYNILVRTENSPE